MTSTVAFLGLRSPDIPLLDSLAADALIYSTMFLLTWILG